jgi:hypothetical protein
MNCFLRFLVIRNLMIQKGKVTTQKNKNDIEM